MLNRMFRFSWLGLTTLLNKYYLISFGIRRFAAPVGFITSPSFPARQSIAGANASVLSHRRSQYETQVLFNPGNVLCVGSDHRLFEERFCHHVRGRLEFDGGLHGRPGCERKRQQLHGCVLDAGE
jgi:hypothetical protein